MIVTIESVIKLEASDKTAIEKLVKPKVKNAEFIYVVNPKILGGLRVSLGSKRVDLSLLGKLRELQKVL